jgi:sigma-B regulation protein RsbU (phosphoserine phosphatase)
VAWCGAGHPPAFLVGKEGSCAELESQCAMLGLHPDAEFTSSACEGELDFSGDAAILAYTDGAEEARNEEGVFFGPEKLRQILSQERSGTREAWPQKIMASVDAHRGGPPQDDVLIVAAYLGSAQGEAPSPCSPHQTPPLRSQIKKA